MEPAAGPAESCPYGGGAGIGAQAPVPTGSCTVNAAESTRSKFAPRSRKGQGAGVYVWRGRTYIGADAVAAASGTSRRTVQYHLTRHGDLSALGNGSGGHNRGCIGAPGHPVNLLGRRWPSINRFADTLGVTPKTATHWLRRGMLDRIMARLMLAGAGRGGAT